MTDEKIRIHQILNIAKRFDIGNVESVDAERSTGDESEYLGFSFQACERATQVVKFGSPYEEHRDNVQAYPPDLQYIRARVLPSSVHETFIRPHPENGAGRYRLADITIKYEIQAYLRRSTGNGTTLLAQTMSEVILLNGSAEPQPPTCVADFRTEYSLLQSATRTMSKAHSLAMKFSRRPDLSPRIVLEASEPEPLILRKTDQYVTTTVPLRLTELENSKTTTSQARSNSCDVVRVTWQLQRSMFSSLKPLKQIPTFDEVVIQKTKACVMRKTVLIGRPQTYTCRLGVWQKGALTTLKDLRTSPGSTCAHKETHEEQPDQMCAGPPILEKECASQQRQPISPPQSRDNSIVSYRVMMQTIERAPSASFVDPSANVQQSPPPYISTMTNTLCIPISMPMCLLPTPTTFTSYMAIRYSLQIKVHAHLSLLPSGNTNDKSGRHSGRSCSVNARLVVPVQIVYDRESVDAANNNHKDSVGREYQYDARNDSEQALDELKSQEEEKEEELPTYAASTARFPAELLPLDLL